MLKKLSKNLLLSCLTAVFAGCQIPVSPALSQAPRIGFKKYSQRQSTLSGNFKYHRAMKSQYLGQHRDIIVYLPPGYKQNSTKKYPVLYMHDGNNIFDRSTSFGGREWQVDENAERLSKSGQIQELIIVGIYNTRARIDEYTWYPMDLDGQMAGGNGANYAKFLVKELKPLIDRTYRTNPGREHTAVMGSSLGGLISFYIGLHYSHVFSKIGMMSPSTWWKDKIIMNDVKSLPQNLKVWVDIGTKEGRKPELAVQNTKDFVKKLEEKGYQHFKNLAFHIAPGAGHNEKAWSERVEHPLRFFFEK